MNNLTEKLSTALSQLNELQTKFSPLGEHIEQLNQKVESLAKYASELVNEVVEIQTITNGYSNTFNAIANILDELKTESEQINHDAKENEILRESMTSMFGEAFNVVSKFIDTAKHIGIIDKNHADQILAGNAIINVTENQSTESSNLNDSESTPQISTQAENDDEIIESENIAETNNNVVDSTDNVATNEFSNTIDQTELTPETDPIANNPLTAIEMASQLDLQPLQFSSTETTTNELTNDATPKNQESETNSEESLEAILDDISQPLSTV
ncbi:MAG: hypothetical protein LBB88_09250 [Planctomycetaceae bacterium]|jgi:predicted RNase H-like nuclease (RuvC/YqgF family)|nr:hypothetical protein [Planctomycetaceae bacterium]